MKTAEADPVYPNWLSHALRSPLVCVLLVWGILFLALGISLALLD